MRRILSAGFLVMVAAFVGSGAALAGSDIHLFLGQKSISDNDLESVDIDKPTEFGLGVNLDFDWPVALTFDVLSASDDHTFSYDVRGTYSYKYELDTTELHAGVRYSFLKDGKIQPYIGGGLAWVMADAKISGSFPLRGTATVTFLDDDDSDISYFLGAGVLFQIGEKFGIGVDLRQSDAEAEFTESDRGSSSDKLDVGGFHYGVTLGYRW